jgi:hypothetical protein
MRIIEAGLGWIATALPGRVRSWLGLCLAMATHCDHATNMSITSQHVSIVERLVDRHGQPKWGFQVRLLAQNHGDPSWALRVCWLLKHGQIV